MSNELVLRLLLLGLRARTTSTTTTRVPVTGTIRESRTGTRNLEYRIYVLCIVYCVLSKLQTEAYAAPYDGKTVRFGSHRPKTKNPKCTKTDGKFHLTHQPKAIDGLMDG
jgi:hypothetical protein